MAQSKPAKIIIHLLGWLLFFSLIIGFVFNSQNDVSVLTKLFSPWYLIFYSFYVFLFYFNSAILIPKLYLQKKYFPYFTIILALFLAVYFLKPFDHLILQDGPLPGEFRPPPPGADFHGPPPGRSIQRVDIVSIVLFVMTWSLSTAIQIIKQWRFTEKRAIRAEADKAIAELSFLKAQINPHFLFNTLNNIYSLAVTKNENAPVAIMKLSNIMRYVTDEVMQDYVPLESEIDCARNYIDLQRMRLNDKVQIDFSVTGNVDSKQVAPLIFMPFIENVFKYGTSSHEPSVITIKLLAEDKTITFFCQNKLFSTSRKIERTGIGIANTRQRLEHVYAGKYLLNITTDDDVYTVQLTINA